MHRETLAVLAIFAAIGLGLWAWPTTAADTSFNNGKLTENGQMRVDVGANDSADNAEWCVTTSVSALTALDGRKEVWLQNLSAIDSFFTFDSTNPTSSGSLGVKLKASDVTVYKFPVGDGLSVRGVAADSMTTPACIQVLQLK